VDDIGLLAILNDPELRSERGESALAQADLTQSTLIPNPSVSLSYAALLGGPGIAGSYTASLAQDVTSLVTYHSRVVAAHDRASQVNADLLWKEWQIAQKARLLATALYWNEQAIQANRAELTAVTQTESQMAQALNRGEISLSAISPVQASKASLEQALAALRMQQLKNWGELDTLLGLTPNVRFAIARPQPHAPPNDLTKLAASMQDRRPDLIALQLGYRSADQDVRTAILGQFPALLLGGSWNSDTSQVRSGGPTVTFDLPIFSRNQGQVAKTRATRLLLREQYQSRLDTSAASVLSLQAQSRAIATQLAAADKNVHTADLQVHAAKAAFDAGNLDARTLADYRSTALARTLQRLDLQRARDETAIALELELGLGLPHVRIAPMDEVKSL
jgi:outer membrane protein TolC